MKLLSPLLPTANSVHGMNTVPKPGSPDIEKRLAARERPSRQPLMFQSWQNLLFLHWEVPEAEIEKLLPPGLRVDTFEGQAWLGIVPFFMRKVRPRFLPTTPGISNFLELNVRTYVYDQSGTPGVWFFSLDANRRLACALGRSLFHLTYRRAAMTATEQAWIDYHGLRHGETQPAHYRYRATGSSRTAQPGSLEFFLLERYVLYSWSPANGALWRGRVHHPPYRINDAEVENFSTSPLQWNRQIAVTGPPQHACVSPRVDVSIFGLQNTTRTGRRSKERQA